MSQLTDKQQVVLDALKAASGPLSAYELLDQLHDHGFRAPPQVYRALSSLTQSGHIHRLETLNAFVACDHKGCGTQSPSVFLICSDCKQVAEVQTDPIQNSIEHLSHDAGFVLDQAVIELSGTCRQCEQAET